MIRDGAQPPPGEGVPAAGKPTERSGAALALFGNAPPRIPGVRRLMARLRDIMAGAGSAEQRLAKIVVLIAAEMQTDVCSCYVRREGDVLELFATQGLDPLAVHRTRLHVGEGLVGLIAAERRPTALTDAPRHPSFVYRPETAEDPFHGFAGVPILRDAEVRGVLTVQHRALHQYAEEEIELLETIAMVVAELVASGGLAEGEDGAAPATGAPSRLLPQRLLGTGLHGGLAIGTAVLHKRRLTLRQMVSEDIGAERARLARALDGMDAEIEALVALSRDAGLEPAAIIETYAMFSRDKGWLNRIHDAIGTGLTAEAAVQLVQDETRARLGQASNAYLRERLHDLEDLANRLQQHLVGRSAQDSAGNLPDDAILVAHSMGPAELLDYDRRKLRGLVLEEGSASSHVAIVARALDIPLVGGVQDAMTRVEPFDRIVVDGGNGAVLLRPTDDVHALFVAAIAREDARKRELKASATLPSVSLDGQRVQLQLNAGLLLDVHQLAETGADGIGLYRTEIQFMVRSAYPDVHMQTQLYRSILDAAGGRHVHFRTLDIGGDKLLPYLPQLRQPNPALGWRAIRMATDRPAILRTQLRALLAAAAGRELSVMMPMIAEIEEFRTLRGVLDRELDRLMEMGAEAPTQLRVGVMLEVPSLIFQLPALLPLVDFISIGTNDLLQYTFAADRDNPLTAQRYDFLSPVFLALLRVVQEQCAIAGKPVSICGEMAGAPLGAMALLGIGFRRLSAAPQRIVAVRHMLRRLNIGEVQELMEHWLVRAGWSGSPRSFRHLLTAYARDHGVPLDLAPVQRVLPADV